MRGERGVVLLEVLVALLILMTAAVASIAMIAGGLRAQRSDLARERDLATEERLLTACTLLTRRDLDARIGRRHVGEFLIDIQRPTRALYRIAVLATLSPQVEDLVTVVYRPDPR